MFDATGWTLVTGGAGFIGGHIAERLLDLGQRVRVLDNFSTGKRDTLLDLNGRFPRTLSVIEGDLRDAETVRRGMEGVSHVVHQAALPSVQRSIEDPIATHEVNATGTLRLLQAAHAADVQRFVFAGSSSVYGDQPESPKHEAMKSMPKSPYALSKLMGEHYGTLFAELYGLPTITLRYFNVFGPRQRPDSDYAAVIPLFLRALLRGDRPTIYGDGLQTRDFTYISNVVDANVLALAGRGTNGSVLNIACGGSTSLLDVLAALQDIVGRQVDPQFEPARAGDVRHSQARIDRARQELGFEPEIGLREGLERTVHWFQEQGVMR